MARAIAFGEGMIELSRHPDGAARIAYGGDTLNTAVYMARLGIDIGFMSAIGHDPWSDELVAFWRDEGVDCGLVLRHPTRLPGIYGISLSGEGERSFFYWRQQAAARAFFECPEADNALLHGASADLLLFSGISLAVLEGCGVERTIALAKAVRARGGRVAFDPNYRARLWSSVDAYRKVILAVAPVVDIALPSFDDEALVWGDTCAEDSLRRWSSHGVSEVVVKDGARGALTDVGFEPAVPVAKVVDTTGAGDSFNAGYLARRLAGDDALAAAAFGARIAACVVQHGGAIIPRAAFSQALGDKTP